MKLKMAENSLFAILLRSPWWVSIAAAAGVFAAARLALAEAYAAFIALPFAVIGVYTFSKQIRAPSAAEVAQTRDALRAMSWDEFSNAVEHAFRNEGYAVSRIDNAGADFELTKANRVSLLGCRRWKTARTGIEPLRELHAAMRERDAHACIYIAAGEVTDTAKSFAAKHAIQLVHDAELAKRLPRSVRRKSA